ncbi:MAG: response regulator [Treponema sp.]|nr:response regulator [Treponema sp.]
MGSEQKRILIMEDSDIFADMLMCSFDSSKYILERAVNGFEGIKKTYSFLPHLIITDIEMPLFKGYQVTRHFKSRKNTKTIPVIMFTSLNKIKDKFWAEQTGADFYIEKSPDNISPLLEAAEKLISSSQDIDFDAIEKEGKKINDNTIIETVNNLLDNKLFQTTIIGSLIELSSKIHSMDDVISGIFDLLHTLCEADIISLLIRGNNRVLHNFTVNYGGFTKKISDNFFGICNSDFNALFSGFKFSFKNIVNFSECGANKKNILSYTSFPLTIGGENFASLHIGNRINDYFSPVILENIRVFTGASAPIIANALSMQEIHELQKNTRTAFARYVPADVMDEIINETTKKVQMSENRNVSVLFSDIRNFTELSEHSDAQSVVNFLNIYFAKMGNEIISEGGHIDKFIGDAIMAVFGAFNTQENSPENAIRAALKMLAAMDYINESGAKLSKEKIRIGIGINCGNCILGNIGSKNKMDYTIIGDTVNLASRIESLTKIYQHPLIVSENVYEAVKEKMLFRKIDNVRVKGRNKSIGIYAVYSGFYGEEGKKLRSGETSEDISVSNLLINRETLSNYNKGLQVFYMREWKLANEYFKKALDTENSDYLSKLYFERTQKFIESPPGEDWDGVITLLEK